MICDGLVFRLKDARKLRVSQRCTIKVIKCSKNRLDFGGLLPCITYLLIILDFDAAQYSFYVLLAVNGLAVC